MKQIDSIQPPARRPHPGRTAKPQVRTLATGARFTAFTGTKRRQLAWGTLLVVALSPILFGLAMVGLAGMGVVVIFGAVALARRWPSRAVFLLALMALVYMALLQLAAAADTAQAMAVLAYILLAIGVISLALEVRMGSRVWFKKH